MKLFIYLSSICGGGAERILVEVANSLPMEKFNTKIITRDNLASPYSLYSERISLNFQQTKNHIRKIFGLIKVFKKYVHILKERNVDISLSGSSYDNIMNIVASKFAHTTAIISVHGMPSFSYSKINKLSRKMSFFLAKYYSIPTIVVSQGVKTELVQIFHLNPNQIYVLYNPINTSKIHVLSQDEIPNYGINFDIPIVITVGRLSIVKSQWHLIRAFASLRQERPAQLLICGVGDEEAYLKTLAKDMGIADSVIFLGWQDNPYKYMARADVFVLSSLSESFGNVLVEAMASGCPVISADCSPGVHEIIGEHNEYGLLAEKMTGIRHAVSEPLDAGEQSLFVLMKRLLDDKELHAGLVQKGRERAEFFSLERRIKEYEDFLEAQIQ